MKKILAILVLLLLVGYNQPETTQQPQPQQPQTQVVEPAVYREIANEEIRSVAETVASQEYIKDIHDCTEFSSDLVIALRGLGYKAKSIYGHLWDGNTCTTEFWCNKEEGVECINEKCFAPHAWTALTIGSEVVNIEAVKGKVIMPDYYRDNYLE